jgi:hypothetical protein
MPAELVELRAPRATRSRHARSGPALLRYRVRSTPRRAPCARPQHGSRCLAALSAASTGVGPNIPAIAARPATRPPRVCRRQGACSTPLSRLFSRGLPPQNCSLARIEGDRLSGMIACLLARRQPRLRRDLAVPLGAVPFPASRKARPARAPRSRLSPGVARISSIPASALESAVSYSAGIDSRRSASRCGVSAGRLSAPRRAGLRPREVARCGARRPAAAGRARPA